MASDNHANYALVGLTVLLGVAGIVAALLYLGGIRDQGDLVYAETYYDKSVSGLSVGSAVNFRGVKIGEVKEIDFVGNHYAVQGAENQRIYILMGFPQKMVREWDHEGCGPDRVVRDLVSENGVRATVTASGITGLSRIELDNQPNAGQPPPISWKPRHSYIPPAVSLLDSFSDSATKVMNQINTMDLNAAWSNINASVQALAHTTDGARQMMETRKADVERLVGDLSETLSAFKQFAEEVKDNPSLLLRERTRTPLPETKR